MTNHPTPQQVQTVIDNLELANKMAKYDAKVNMYNGEVDINLCGTPMCHGGWYAIVRGGNSYTKGSSHMADDLGFEHFEDLEYWAKENPTIWGNDNGSYMFCAGEAFNQSDDTGFTLTTIINHWKQVKINLENRNDGM